MRFDVNMLVSVDVVDPGAVREAAWQIVANPAGRTTGVDEFADQASRTPEAALSVIFGGTGLFEALERAVGDLPGLELVGVYVGLDMVARK